MSEDKDMKKHIEPIVNHVMENYPGNPCAEIALMRFQEFIMWIEKAELEKHIFKQKAEVKTE